MRARLDGAVRFRKTHRSRFALTCSLSSRVLDTKHQTQQTHTRVKVAPAQLRFLRVCDSNKKKTQTNTHKKPMGMVAGVLADIQSLFGRVHACARWQMSRESVAHARTPRIRSACAFGRKSRGATRLTTEPTHALMRTANGGPKRRSRFGGMYTHTHEEKQKQRGECHQYCEADVRDFQSSDSNRY